MSEGSRFKVHPGQLNVNTTCQACAGREWCNQLECLDFGKF
jgi:hypothetical protein